MEKVIEWTDLEVMPYLDAWKLQDKLREKRINGKINDRLLLVEHKPVFTLGRRECSADFLSDFKTIERDGIKIVSTNRGGRVTYHGPGQVVGYFICELSSFGIGIKDFVRSIEEICLHTLSDFGIKAHRDNKYPGIWIGFKKIVAIGLNVSHGVTQHGFALNVDCDLNPYRHIIACGIKDRGVTSMKMEIAKPPAISEVKNRIIGHTEKIFSRRAIEI